MRVLLQSSVAKAVPVASDRPIEFHRRLPGYRASPLVEAPRLAEILGVARVFVKDETSRFGLPSFKILGASWATYAALREQLGPLPDGPLSYERLRAWAAPSRPLTLIAATDGNHGRAVARVAQWLGLRSRIFVPSFVSFGRRAAIEAEGAQLEVVDDVYDASVDAALAAAQTPDTLLVTDTARSTSDLLPQLVSAGYLTAFAEIDDQLDNLGETQIDAVSVQAGVGGLAAATTNWALSRRHGRSPRVIVVEPTTAASVMTGLAAGEPVAVSANIVSSMSCLQCGTVSLTSFAELQAGVSCCLAIEDIWAATAVSELRSCGLRTGLSGAAGVAGLLAAFSGPFNEPVRQYLEIFSDARLLVMATESVASDPVDLEARQAIRVAEPAFR